MCAAQAWLPVRRQRNTRGVPKDGQSGQDSRAWAILGGRSSRAGTSSAKEELGGGDSNCAGDLAGLALMNGGGAKLPMQQAEHVPQLERLCVFMCSQLSSEPAPLLAETVAMSPQSSESAWVDIVARALCSASPLTPVGIGRCVRPHWYLVIPAILWIGKTTNRRQRKNARSRWRI